MANTTYTQWEGSLGYTQQESLLPPTLTKIQEPDTHITTQKDDSREPTPPLTKPDNGRSPMSDFVGYNAVVATALAVASFAITVAAVLAGPITAVVAIATIAIVGLTIASAQNKYDGGSIADILNTENPQQSRSFRQNGPGRALTINSWANEQGPATITDLDSKGIDLVAL